MPVERRPIPSRERRHRIRLWVPLIREVGELVVVLDRPKAYGGASGVRCAHSDTMPVPAAQHKQYWSDVRAT